MADRWAAYGPPGDPPSWGFTGPGVSRPLSFGTDPVLTLVLGAGGLERLGDRLADVLGQVVEGDGDRFAGRAVRELGRARREAALAYRDAERDADQLGVAELHAGPVRAVVDDHVHSGGEQRLVSLLPRRGDRGVVLLRDDDDRLERRDRGRPDGALFA